MSNIFLKVGIFSQKIQEDKVQRSQTGALFHELDFPIVIGLAHISIFVDPESHQYLAHSGTAVSVPCTATDKAIGA